jgi:predicted dehydrogenase
MGKMGKIRAREIQENRQTELIAVYDITENHNDIRDVKICRNIDDLLGSGIDAVFICAYNNVNAEYTIKALSSGLHVFCEKPPSRTSQELEEVIKVEKKTNKILKYGFNHRYHYSVLEAKKLVDSKMLGKLLWLRGIYGKAGGNKFEKNWRNDKNLSGGGILIDQGIHMLDLMIHFAGKFEEIQSSVQTQFWDIPVEDNVFAILKTGHGVVAMFHSSATQWRHKFTLDMCFEDGYINLEGILSSTRSYGDEILIIARKQFEDSTFAIGKPREERIFFDTDDSWKLELQDFIDAIKNNQPVRYGNSADAQNVLKTVEEIYHISGYTNA